MVKATGKRITRLQLFQVNGGLLGGWLTWEHIPFLLLYCWVLHWCYMTAGEPYNHALAKAEAEGVPLPNTVEHLKAQASLYLLKSGEPTPKPPSFWSFLEEGPATPPPPTEPEFRLPSKHLPSFWPLFALGTIATLHALVMLLQVWLVDVKCWVQFRGVLSVSRATHVKVTPAAHRGKKVLLPLEKGMLGTSLTFQRRKYIYDPADDTFHKVRCKTDYPLSFFARWTGFTSQSQVIDAQERYGKNMFEIALPAFMDLYKQQLVSPFTVFQLFCVILWCLDSYWQYSVFTLFMIFSFEASVVMQRIKNLNTLKGMDNTAIDAWVYRGHTWQLIRTTELVPGDVFSLNRTNESDIVPCDCLLLRGSTVVNEATLTGESIPQMKEAVHASSEEILDLKSGAAKVHVLFGGTRVLQVSPGGEEVGGTAMATYGLTPLVIDDNRDAMPRVERIGANDGPLCIKSIPSPPDGGCVSHALRTGFSSSQGKLVRMIEGSTESVRPDTRDTALLLLFLLIFAVAASGYVLKRGMEDGNKSKYQLLLHCVLIITSVIPPELPMQMALAVSNALMTLMKMQIFCTEPFRVPMAGKIDVCLFDKTGTLTTDELVAVGVTDLRTPPPSGESHGGSETASLGLAGMAEAPPEATVVLGVCHALVLIDGKVAGDPIEAAALKAIKWEVVGRQCRPQPQQHAARGSFSIGGLRGITAIEIMARHHFSSKLQRMSVVAKVSGGGPAHEEAVVLVKGSPEALATLIKPAALPGKYHEAAARLAKEGMRVLALAYKVIEGTKGLWDACESRADAESGLEFAGFVAFTCRVRRDTAAVIAQLFEGNNSVAMVTGDALLTAVHVAKQVGICRRDKKGIRILANDGEAMYWESYETGNRAADFDAHTIPQVAAQYDLCSTGKALEAASQKHPEIRRHLEHFVVYARMTPDEKEAVITSLKDCGRVCLMCGDGANDVGALKQAHVGVALLSGFGDLNVDRGQQPQAPANDEAASTAIMTQSQLEGLQKLRPSELKKKLRAIGVAPEDHPSVVEKSDLIKLYQAAMQRKAIQAHDRKNTNDAANGKKTPQELRAEAERQRQEQIAKKREELMREMQERTARGESFVPARAMWAVWQKDAQENRKRREQMMKDSTLTASAAKMAAMMDEVGDSNELPMVKIGDASVAAPFTSKMPSIRGTVDIIRQGRCTLVTTIQMYQILALTCLISSYSLSVLHFEGIKYGDYQMTALGILMSISYVTVSRSKPLDRLSGVRPFSSIFHPALFISILGQFALHLATMMVAVHASKKHLPPDYKPSPDGEFRPLIVNSVVFLVSAVQQVSVFVVNLKGPPFMTGMKDNSPLLYSLVITFVLVFVLASETFPKLNKFLQLVPFPTSQFRAGVLLLLVGDLVCSFVWDRLMTLLFAPRVLRASFAGWTRADTWSVVKVFLYVGAGLYVLARQDLDELSNELLGEAMANATGNATMDALRPSLPPRPTLPSKDL